MAFYKKIDFIREIREAEKHRKKEHGRILLQKAENYFKERGIYKITLTTDAAPTFYKNAVIIKTFPIMQETTMMYSQSRAKGTLHARSTYHVPLAEHIVEKRRSLS